jgi:hypothetical protein
MLSKTIELKDKKLFMSFCILHPTINNLPFEPITTFAQGNLIAQTF